MRAIAVVLILLIAAVAIYGLYGMTTYYNHLLEAEPTAAGEIRRMLGK